MSQVNIIKLTSQEIIIARVDDENDTHITVSHPMLLHVEGRDQSSGNLSIMFIPFGTFTASPNKMKISKSAVVYSEEADGQITPTYQEKTGQIIQAKSKLIV